MENLAVHMRVSGIAVSDDEVNSRRSAATSLANTWLKVTNVTAIVNKAEAVAQALTGDGRPPAALGEEIQRVIQKKSSSFLYEERPLDVSVCAGMAMVSMFRGTPRNGGWTPTDLYAAALWSILAYQPVLDAARRETLRREVLASAAQWVKNSAEKARERTEVPNPSNLTVTLQTGNVFMSNLPEAVASTVEALCRNAVLDREELDFLWWAQLGRSRLLKRQLSVLSEPTRLVSAGIEAAKLLRRFPADVHREIVLRTLDQNMELDVTELLQNLGEDRLALSATCTDGTVAAHPTVFPLLGALATGQSNVAGGTVRRCVSEWAERALLEACFANMMRQGPGQL